jgi:hypothetical protein
MAEGVVEEEDRTESMRVEDEIKLNNEAPTTSERNINNNKRGNAIIDEKEAAQSWKNMDAINRGHAQNTRTPPPTLSCHSPTPSRGYSSHS